MRFATTGVTVISSRLFKGERFFTMPFSVKMLPPSKYVLSPREPLQFA